MSSGDRRSSIQCNIDRWLDTCKSDEPDSTIYDPDFEHAMTTLRAEEKLPEREKIYKVAFDLCSKMGVHVDSFHERFNEVDEFMEQCANAVIKDLHDDFERLCRYKQDLLDQVQKITTDLYLPKYVPADDITLVQHCKKLKTEFNKLNAIKEERMKRLKELRDKQIASCSVLGIVPPQIHMQTDIPTDEELATLARAVFDLAREEKQRKEKYTRLKEQIEKCTELLEISPIQFDQLPSYTEASLRKLSDLHSKLESQYNENMKKYEKLKEKLISLYDRLDVLEDERDSFLRTHNTCKPSIMIEMEVEIDQYEELKKQNIDKFIIKMKRELELEYERCFWSEKQQEQFFSLSTEASEELLELYEKELERLRGYYEENRELLDKFQKWRQMWKELIDLEVKASDPNRFNNRGGQLLAEERKRKTLQKGIPKVEKDLIDINSQYLAKNGYKFKVFGTDLDEFIAGCWEELNNAKEEEKRERQRARMTPSKTRANMSRVPQKSTPLKRALGGSRLLGALSLSEQEFEDMVVSRPTSAKRPNKLAK